MKDDQEFIERRIVTGLIVSTEYIERLLSIWNPIWMESAELKRIADWCFDYFKKYKQAPDSTIQDIYMEELKKDKIPKADALYIEELLQDLSDEYGRGTQFNYAYLYDQTIKYFKVQELELHNQQIQYLMDTGEAKKAQELAMSFTPTVFEDKEIGLELSSREGLKAIERAFIESRAPVITYPGVLGQVWNEQLVRGAFFTLLAPEKRGKSFLLMEFALRAIRQKANVAFFEAGDMTQAQLLRRICIYIAQKSDKEKYCQERFRPIGDCVYNQLDICDRDDRNCDHGIFDISLETFYNQLENFINLEVLEKAYEENPNYAPCDSSSCHKRKGSVWLEKVPKRYPLRTKTAKKKVRSFFKKYRRRFMLVNYPAGILTVAEMKKVLNGWERRNNFIPDVIIIDYADLLSASDAEVSEYRHRQDHIWKSLRALSQERHALVITATQADSESYKKGRLSLSNFSEDKRKLSHVTAQYGLNQDPDGREKKLGIMRINEIVVREGEFSPDSEVHILQDLAAGRPFLESF